MRDSLCPICNAETDAILHLQFNEKLKLPTKVSVRHCASDNFLFTAPGRQQQYNEYYASIVNDSYHAEVSANDARSPISKLQREHLVKALAGFFDSDRRVLDYGCGEGCLLVELASHFPTSTFYGFDPSPAGKTVSQKAQNFALNNLTALNIEKIATNGPYDLIIASHLMEHLLDFDLLRDLSTLLAEGALLYVEVPGALQYKSYGRREFLYYFDRLHVNHFTAQSLNKLAAGYGYGYLDHFQYAFPYRDGAEYPALGMLFRKGGENVRISSASVLESARTYIAQEQLRSTKIAAQFDEYEGILVWGAGDNFYRSVENGGPLSNPRNMIALDRRTQKIVISGRKYETMDPVDGVRHYSWPVVITISEGTNALINQIHQVDPKRRVFLL